MTILREIELRPASVREDRSFLDAARVLLAARISAIAVLDRDERVVGLFTDDDLLGGLFPPYLEELRHTAFLVDGGTLQASAEAAARETVGQHMRRPVTVEVDAGAAHVVERFLHTPWGAIAVVESGRFVGMVDQLDLISRLLERADLPHG
jgi:CBS-domain-containing membrane protein